MWNELKSEITKKNIVKVFIWLVGTIIIIKLTIYYSNINENMGRSELSIIDKQYEIKWRPVIDPNDSDLNTNERYQVIVGINVINNKDSNYQAEITNAEYFLSDSDSQVDYWRASPDQFISIQPGTNSQIGASHIVKLDPGNYTLKSVIDYQDKKGIRTPLRLSAKLLISYNKSKIEDIAP